MKHVIKKNKIKKTLKKIVTDLQVDKQKQCTRQVFCSNLSSFTSSSFLLQQMKYGRHGCKGYGLKRGHLKPKNRCTKPNLTKSYNE